MLRVMDPESDARKERSLIERAILTDQISSLRLSQVITLPSDATLQQVVEIMQREHIGCMLLVDGAGKLNGIFTERDLLNKVAGRKLDWAKERVNAYMTPDPESLRLDDRIVWALNLMSMGGYRHVPLTDDGGRPVGVVSIKDIVEFTVDLFPEAVLNLPPDPHRKPGSDDVGGGAD